MSAGHGPFDHVKDSAAFELPGFVTSIFGFHEIVLPKIGSFQITKFMVLQTVAALLTILIFRGLSRRIAGGRPANGLWWNFWEAIALFVRNEVVRPCIGIPHHHDHGGDDHGHGEPHHDAAHASEPAHGATEAVSVAHPADRYLPFVWSVFFYILFCNLLGAFPFLGSPTADTSVTGVLALMTFLHVVRYGSEQSGFVGYWKSLVPGMELPGVLAIFLIPMIWVIEAAGLLIKHAVLALRLFANLLGGHTVISVFLGFIAASADYGSIWWLVMPASTIGQLAIGLLELFVAFLQAYVFSMMTSLFISAAVNPH
ncbi:MAG: F0F1 ATP synthase subunit A [Candidatus Saccharimonas sp.]|nr:F0F1 ATP synthase subunit A [Planctomycetaceae bacterium]